jgi:hypothetical protein
MTDIAWGENHSRDWVVLRLKSPCLILRAVDKFWFVLNCSQCKGVGTPVLWTPGIAPPT